MFSVRGPCVSEEFVTAKAAKCSHSTKGSSGVSEKLVDDKGCVESTMDDTRPAKKKIEEAYNWTLAVC